MDDHEELKRIIEEQHKENEERRERRRAHARLRYANWTPERKKQKFATTRSWARKTLEERAGRPKPTTCEACGHEGKIVFDHNHTTGAFRGWICMTCNIFLGYIDDDIGTLERLITMLKERT